MHGRVDRLIGFEVLVEGLTGLALIAAPKAVCAVLLGEEPGGTGAAVGRVAGIALLSLVASAWLARRERGGRSALVALLLYNALTAAYLSLLGVQGDWVGPLLWPAVAAHLVIGSLLAAALSRSPQA